RLAGPPFGRHRVGRGLDSRSDIRARLRGGGIRGVCERRRGGGMSNTNVILLGVGAIGRELLRQLATNHRTLVSSIRVCALVDRSGFVFEPAGLSWRRVMELRAHKASGKSLATADGGRPSRPEDAVDTITAKSGG